MVEKNKFLTKAEEQIMQILWEKEKVLIRDILDTLPEPKPAYNTVSTIVRILEKKEFVAHKAYGKTHEYFPLVSKKDYTRQFMRSFMQGYFGSSFKKMVSFFAQEEKLDIKEIEDLLKELKENEDKNDEQTNKEL